MIAQEGRWHVRDRGLRGAAMGFERDAGNDSWADHEAKAQAPGTEMDADYEILGDLIRGGQVEWRGEAPVRHGEWLTNRPCGTKA